MTLRRRPALVAAVCVLLSGGVSCSGAGPDRESAAAAGADTGKVRDDPYLKLTLEDSQGRVLRLDQYQGKVRLIDVWASWCGPCRMIIPHLNRLYDRYRGQGLVVIGVSVDEDPGAVDEFTRQIPIRYPAGMMNPEIGDLLGHPDAVPTTYLVDRHGRVRRKFIGFVEPATIEREVRRFLDAR